MRRVLDFRALPGVCFLRLLFLLEHDILAQVFSESSALEAFQILVKNGP
jgi:hypothetical protein